MTNRANGMKQRQRVSYDVRASSSAGQVCRSSVCRRHTTRVYSPTTAALSLLCCFGRCQSIVTPWSFKLTRECLLTDRDCGHCVPPAETSDECLSTVGPHRRRCSPVICEASRAETPARAPAADGRSQLSITVRLTPNCSHCWQVW